MSYTADREELRKRITTLAAEGDRIVLLDNLSEAIGNDILDATLTGDHWKDRLLGGNIVNDGPLHVCWYGTGKPYLPDAFELAEPGQTHVGGKHLTKAQGPNGWRNCNLRTTFEKLVKRVGLKS
jgi:hypothetical protein